MIRSASILRPRCERSDARQSVGHPDIRRLATAATWSLSGLLALLILSGHCVAGERQSGTAYVIALRPQAIVSSDVIRLSDIATISGPSRTVCERLGQLDIDDAPTAGQRQSVTSLQVEFRLQLTGIQRSACRVAGTNCEVHRAAGRPVSYLPLSNSRPAEVVSAVVEAGDTPASDHSTRVNRLNALLAEQLQRLAQRSTNKPRMNPGVQHAAHNQSVDQPQLTGVDEQAADTALAALSPRERVISVARTAILDRLPWEKKDVRIDVTHIGLRAAVESIVTHGNLTPEIRSAWPPLGRVQVVVRAVSADSSDVSEIPVVLNVRYFQNVVVAKRRITRGTVIADEDVYLDRQEVRDLASTLTSSKSVVGMTATRDILPLNMIRPGDVKTAASIRATQPVIRRGTTVNLVARGGGLAITVLAEAMQDGRPGDVIRVKNLDSQQIRTGKVLSANEVEVSF